MYDETGGPLGEEMGARGVTPPALLRCTREHCMVQKPMVY